MNGRHRICSLIVLLALGLATPVSAADADDSGREYDRIKKELADRKKDLRRENRKERSVLSELDKIDHDLQRDLAELSLQKSQLTQKEEALRATETAAAEAEYAINGLRLTYGKRLRALYKSRRHSVSDLDGSGSMVKQATGLAKIAERDRRIIREYRAALVQLQRRRAELAEETKTLLGQRQLVEQKRSELEEAKHRKSLMLEAVRKKKSVFEQSLHELEEASASLWAMIKKDEETRHEVKGADAAAVTGSAGNRLPWPLEGKVITLFGMQRHPQFGTMVFRRGIEIEAREGQEVHAVEAGKVVYADWYKGYGMLIILDHGKGFYSLYGNLSRLDRAKDDSVVRGQRIGLAGETGSLKGVKLYFEMRRDGEARDPLMWLSPKQVGMR